MASSSSWPHVTPRPSYGCRRHAHAAQRLAHALEHRTDPQLARGRADVTELGPDRVVLRDRPRLGHRQPVLGGQPVVRPGDDEQRIEVAGDEDAGQLARRRRRGRPATDAGRHGRHSATPWGSLLAHTHGRLWAAAGFRGFAGFRHLWSPRTRRLRGAGSTSAFGGPEPGGAGHDEGRRPAPGGEGGGLVAAVEDPRRVLLRRRVRSGRSVLRPAWRAARRGRA